ncbi:MAG: trypsin-like peptidase domain-containing protein [Enhygromyxa sp.]
MSVRRRATSPLGLFFLGFCVLGAPLLATGSLGCSNEAQASPPTVDAAEAAELDARTPPSIAPPLASKPQAQITQETYWRQGNGVAIVDYDLQQSLAPLIEAVQPAVVSIHTRSRRGMFATSGMGSGFVISADGLVVTNHHVVAGNEKLEVHLPDGRRFEGTVIGSDPQTDVAVVRLAGAKGLPTVVLGSSDTIRVGDWVVAMGSPMGLERTVTRGIVSAQGRGSLGLYRDGYADFLQTDAAINPGNSGGPLFNLAGEVIGINTAIGGHDGLGFAVPVNQAKVVIPQLIEHGKVTRGWLGISGRDEPPEYGVAPDPGALISEVHPGGPGAAAGLQVGDRVVEIEGKAITNFDGLRNRVGEFPPNSKVELVIARNGQRKTVSVTLDERPDPDSLARFVPSAPGPNKPSPGPAPKPKQGGDLYDGKPARLGVEVRETSEGVLIERVVEGGVGHRLGLRSGDVIERVNGKSIGSIAEIVGALEGDRSKAEVTVKRGKGRHMAVISEG